MRERLGKHNTTVTMGSDVGLPPELIDGAVQRVGWAGAAYAMVAGSPSPSASMGVKPR